jgi:hypothetical protein
VIVSQEVAQDSLTKRCEVSRGNNTLPREIAPYVSQHVFAGLEHIDGLRAQQQTAQWFEGPAKEARPAISRVATDLSGVRVVQSVVSDAVLDDQVGLLQTGSRHMRQEG